MAKRLRPHTYLNKPAVLWLIATLPAYLLVRLALPAILWWGLFIFFIIAAVVLSLWNNSSQKGSPDDLISTAKNKHSFALYLPLIAALLAWCSIFTIYLSTLERDYNPETFPTQPEAIKVKVIEPLSGKRPAYIVADTYTGKRYRWTSPTPLPDSLIYGGEIELIAQPYPTQTITSSSFRNYLRGHNIHGTISSSARIVSCQKGTPSFKQQLLRLRARWISYFDQISADRMSSDQRSILYALTLGTASSMPSEVRNNFTTAGVAHILAVSGFHLGIILLLTNWLLRRFLYKYRYRYVRAIILMVVLTLYTLFTGASPSTVRSLIMALIALSATLLSRPTYSIQILALTVVLILLFAPYQIFSIGLILSVSAVWGIVVFYAIFTHFLQPSQKILRQLYDLIAISVAAQVGVFPWLLYFFGSAGISFIWSAIPISLLATIIIPLGIIIMIIGTTPGIAILSGILHLMQQTTALISTLPMPTISMRFDLLGVFLYYALIAAIYLVGFRFYNRIVIVKSKF